MHIWSFLGGFVMGVSLIFAYQSLQPSAPPSERTTLTSEVPTQELPLPESPKPKRKAASKVQKIAEGDIGKAVNDLYKVVRVAKMLNYPPKDQRTWLAYYDKVFNGQPKAILSKLANLEASNKSVHDKFLCKKGYYQFCEKFVQQLRGEFGSDGRALGDPSMDKELNVTARHYLMRACQGYSASSCKKIASDAKSLPKDNKKEFSDFIVGACKKGWNDGCLAYAVYLRVMGFVPQATKIAVNICKKSGKCSDAGSILVKMDPKASSEYYLRDCRMNSDNGLQGCSDLLRIFPNSRQAGEARDYLATICEKMDLATSGSCTVLANYYSKQNRHKKAAEYLRKGCMGGNQTACHFAEN